MRLKLLLFGVVMFAGSGSLRAQWVEISGLYMSDIFSVDSVLFVTNSGGLFRSEDNGKTWSHVFVGESGASNDAVSFKAFGSLLFLKTYEAKNFRSTDGGKTWEGLPIRGLNGFCISNGEVLAGRYDGNAAPYTGLSVSTDDGVDWSHRSSALDSVYVNDIENYGADLVAATSVSVWRSSDGGVNWFNPRRSGGSGVWLSDTFWTDDRHIFYTSIKDHFSDPISYVRCLGQNLIEYPKLLDFTKDGIPGIYLSTDGGATWISPKTPPQGTQIYGLYIYSPNAFVTSDSGLSISLDSGITWSLISHSIDRRFFEKFAEIGSAYFIGGDSGILRSTDQGNAWQAVGYGADGGRLLLVDDSLYVFGENTLGVTGLYKSTDDGLTWSNVGKPLSLFRDGWQSPTFLGFADSIMFGWNWNGFSSEDSIFYSTDFGASWKGRVLNGVSNGINTFCSVGSNLFIGTQGNGVLKSTDSGKSWIQVSEFDSTVYSLVSNGGDIIAGAYRGLYRSTDEGNTWSSVSTGLSDTVNSGFSHVVADGSTICSSYENYLQPGQDAVFISTDNGSTWIKKSTSLRYPSALALRGTDIFYGADDGGVNYSTDLGQHWIHDTVGFIYGSSCKIIQLIVNDKSIYALSSGTGSIYRRSLSELTGTSAVKEKHQSVFNVEASVFPNPFSSSTTISFTPETSGYADVSIVNLLGVEVAHLFSGELDAAEHSFMWSNPTGLPDGVYECQIRMNGRIEKLPMVLLH